jgi:tetratricopeptide (TPR) repeat protein
MEKVEKSRFPLLAGALAGLALAASAPAPALAQPSGSVEEAQVHFKRGAELYDEDNYRGALIEFQRAYELAPSYRILFNIGQVEMELQNYAGALRAYQRYLREGGPDVPAARTAQVTQEIERLKGRVGQITIETTDGAEVFIDEISIGFAPLPEPALVNAGRHKVAVHIAGRDPVSRVVDLAGQQELTVALANDLSPSAAAARVSRKSEDSKPSGPPSKTPMYIAWGATGVFAIAAGVFAYTAYSASSDLEDLRNTYPVTKEELEDKASEQRTASLLADGFTAATLVAGGVSLYLTLTRPSEEKKPSKLSLGVAPTGAFVTGSF